jgi:hypothetical protein
MGILKEHVTVLRRIRGDCLDHAEFFGEGWRIVNRIATGRSRRLRKAKA